MQFTSAQKRAAAWAMIAVLTALVLWLLAPVLTPFVVAAVLAYALTPLVNRLDSWFGGRMPRVVAVILVEALFLLVLLAVLLLILPILVKEMPLLREQVPVLFDRLNETVKPFLAQFGIKFALDVGSIKDFILKYLNTNAEDSIGSLHLIGQDSVAVWRFAVLGNAVLIPVVLFYLLNDWDHFVSCAGSFVPPRMRTSPSTALSNEADAVLGQYLRGQLLVMLMLAVFYSVGLVLFGLGFGLADWYLHRLGRVCALFGFWFGYGFGALVWLAAIRLHQSFGDGGCRLRCWAIGGKLFPDATLCG
jgi:predicted PurR-regulated permease PerM